jgi:hypothetical protein
MPDRIIEAFTKASNPTKLGDEVVAQNADHQRYADHSRGEHCAVDEPAHEKAPCSSSFWWRRTSMPEL